MVRTWRCATTLAECTWDGSRAKSASVFVREPPDRRPAGHKPSRACTARQTRSTDADTAQ